MKLSTLGAVMCALVLSGVTASAQSNYPPVTAPSGQNSGAGIPGQPGNKNGPPAARQGTVGSTATTKQGNITTQEQDSARIKGLPGNKSGEPEKRPPH